jgi:protein O-mannosyl-transferase
VLAGLAAYWGIYSSPFIFDDASSIQANASIRHLGEIGKVLRPPAGGETVTGRPIVNLSLAVNYAIGGLSPRGYHALNLTIHLLAGLALFGIARRTLGGTTAAFAIALLWIVHPLQTEAVTYISQRAESLMGLLYLLTLYGFIRYAGPPSSAGAPAGGEPRVGWGWLSAGACLLGMAAKETMVSAPLIVLLYDRTFVAGGFRAALRARGRYYGALAATWILLGYCVAASGRRGGTAGFATGMDPWRYALFQATAICHYLRLSAWPHPLIFDYGTSLAAPPWETALSCAGIAALLAATTWALLRRPTWGFLGAWFFMLLAPSSSIVPVATQVMAEHRMYLPLAAVLAAVVCAAAGWRPFWFPASLLAAALLAALTLARNADYRTARSLWERTVAARPNDPRAREQLAEALSQDPALLQDAAAQDEAALRIDPDDPVAHNNLGNVFLRLPGRLPDSVAQFRAALRANPASATYRANLAAALAGLPGGAQEAVAEYEHALHLDPDNASARNGLGNLLSGVPGRMGDAIAEYEAALRIDPNYAEAHNGLANALAQTPGKAGAAESEYLAALRIRPDYPEAGNNLALLYARTGRMPEAIRELEQVVRTNPGFVGARKNLEILESADPGTAASK